jgi:hypothetical protein
LSSIKNRIMKKTLLTFSLGLLACTALRAQITIVGADMPVNGDTLRYSISLPTAALNLSNTGANIAWDYSTLVPQTQVIDNYKTAADAGYAGGGIPATAFGYKVADTLPGAPIPVNDVYTFFSLKPASTPTRFVAEGFGAMVNGILPVSGGYSNEDTLYNFPLTFSRLDNSSFKLTVNVTLVGATLKQQGTRKTVVDGWGTLKTPYYTTPIQVLRVRSEVDELDSVIIPGTTLAIPRHYVEYKWLASGVHGPALFVTTNIVGTNEVPSSVRYRDSNRGLLGVGRTASAIEALQVYPNPAAGSEVTVKIPTTWSRYLLHVYDVTGKLLSEVANSPKVNTVALPSGRYIIVAECGGAYGIAQFVK